MQAASIRAAPRCRCEYTGAVGCGRDIAIWNPFFWDLAYTIDEADICYVWIETQTGNYLKTGACSLKGKGPPTPELDDGRSDTEQEDGAPEESEIEDTQEIALWRQIQANLDKLEPLVDVEGMSRGQWM